MNPRLVVFKVKINAVIVNKYKTDVNKCSLVATGKNSHDKHISLEITINIARCNQTTILTDIMNNWKQCIIPSTYTLRNSSAVHVICM